MRIWRICRKRYAADALAGRGCLVTSGRWHSVGQPIVYTAESRALAALEVLVHVDRRLAPADLVHLEIDIPDDLDVSTIKMKSLPRDWQSYPAPSALQQLGDNWLSSALTPVLKVPSSVIPEESNVLLNPQHRDASKFAAVSTRDFAYDSRLTR